MIETMKHEKVNYEILKDFEIEITVEHNPYDFQMSDLFQMATRINKKRSFLFVSKVLGKHLAVTPQMSLLIGNLLAMRYMEAVHGIKDERIRAIADIIQKNDDPTKLLRSIENSPIVLEKSLTIIGFAETATALGHAFFSTFSNKAKYIHTTREKIKELTSLINFEEEHSHATSHYVYATNRAFFEDDNEVVLVDDEITTGKTAINIIRTMKEKYSYKKIFTVVSILDWRTAENQRKFQQLEKELDITIHVVSLIKGVTSIMGEPNIDDVKLATQSIVEQESEIIEIHDLLHTGSFQEVSSWNEDGTGNKSPFLKATGRFGITVEEDVSYLRDLKEAGSYLASYRKGEKTLVIGTGEFMYVPMKIASYMGTNVYFQSSTRSPIYRSNELEYTIQSKYRFDSPDNPGLVNYLYNIDIQQYDEIFIFVERLSTCKQINSIVSELKRTGISKINVVLMTQMSK